MLTVGLTGGIGAGKSAVSTRLARLGAVLVDADHLARDVVAPGGPGLAAVVEAFGPGMLGADGALDRPALGARVFGDTAARRTLEGIIHPLVRAETARRMAAAPPDAIVVNDVPLLIETGLAATYHLVVVVTADEARRVRRLARTRGMSRADAYARIRSQADEHTRRAAADALLVNDGTMDELFTAVDALWRDRLVPYEANLRAGRPAPGPNGLPAIGSDPDRSAGARRMAARFAAVAGDRLVRVDHIGPTSVPGLPGRDAIDLQVVVTAGATAQVTEDSRAAGFVPAPARDGRPPAVPAWRAGAGECAVASADPFAPARAVIRPVTDDRWREALLLRDWLRHHSEERARYAAVTRKPDGAAGPETAGPAAGGPTAGGPDLAGPGAEAAEAADPAAGGRSRWLSAALVRATTWAADSGWTPGPASD